MNKNLHGSTLHLNGTSGTGQIFEWLTVQVWESLKKEGPKIAHFGIQKFCPVPPVSCNCCFDHGADLGISDNFSG